MTEAEAEQIVRAQSRVLGATLSAAQTEANIVAIYLPPPLQFRHLQTRMDILPGVGSFPTWNDAAEKIFQISSCEPNK